MKAKRDSDVDDHASVGEAQPDSDSVIRRLDVDTEKQWDEYVSNHPRASLYHYSQWRWVLSDVFGHEAIYLYGVAPDGKLSGVLPLVRMRSRLFGDYIVSLPCFNYGGAIGNSDDLERRLMDRACEVAAEAGVEHIEFRDRFSRGDRWPCRTDKVTMERVLPESVEALWKQLGGKIRAQIRRPEKEGAKVHEGGDERIESFYRVFARNMRDLGTPVYHRRLFEAISRRFPDRIRLIVVEMSKRPVAAAFLLVSNNTVEIPWASSVREYNGFGVNMLLYWRAMALAVEEGKTRFDFGRSTLNSGTYRFKAQWGAVPSQLYWHYWLGKGESFPGLSPNNPKYRLAVGMWKRLPVTVANLIGPSIVRGLP